MLDEHRASALVDRTRALIDIPSESRNERALEQYLRESMPERFRPTLDDDSVIVFEPLEATNGPRIAIVGHTDTVPATGNVPSTQDGDTIFGCGAADMKGGLAVAVEFAHWLDQHPSATSASFVFVFFGREELSADECPLLRTMAKHTLFDTIDFAIVMEPTANAVETGCMGNLVFDLTFDGVSAHSGRPWQGTNAVHRAIAQLNQIAMGEITDVEINGLIFRESASVTELNGGHAANVIPGSATATVNVRYAPHHDPEEIEAIWHARLQGEGVNVVTRGNAYSAPVQVEHEFTKLLLDCGAEALRPKQAWTNVADFAQRSIPAINFGPGDPIFAHKSDEQISAGALLAGFETLTAFAARVSA